MKTPTNDAGSKFDPFKAEFMCMTPSDFMPMASVAKGMYDAYMSVGFTDARAYDLTKAGIIQFLANAAKTGEGEHG